MSPFLVLLLAFQTATGLVVTPPQGQSPDDETSVQLAGVRRIYVDILTGGEEALRFRDMVMSSIQKSKVFLITENPEKADAVLKGAADDQTFIDRHEMSEGLTANAHLSGSKGWRDRFGGTNEAQSKGLSVGEHESSRTEERQHEAFAALRLVSRDGDVIWSSTQESQGAKFTGALVDVAARVTRQLVEDYSRAKARKLVAKP